MLGLGLGNADLFASPWVLKQRALLALADEVRFKAHDAQKRYGG